MSIHLEETLRLARTYQLPNWRYSPLPQLNPYYLASRGFYCSAPLTIKCHICLYQISLADLPPDDPSQLEQLLDGHDEGCLYHGSTGQAVQAGEVYMGLSDIIEEMEAVGYEGGFPLVNSAALWGFIGGDSFLVRKVLRLYDISPDSFTTSFMLKMLGWHPKKNEKGQLSLCCYFCGATVALSDFTLTLEDRHDPRLQSETESGRAFDPVEHHRYFCSWVGRSQFWRVYLQHQEDKFSERTSFRFKTPPLETKRMRVHIDKYLETAKGKIEGGLAKLRAVAEEWDSILGRMQEDPLLAVSEEDKYRPVRRVEETMQEPLGAALEAMSQPLKKIKHD